ncbi:hypothetical protein [Halorussus salinisoli]|uniref:hypothetical protein n=1 Tax=Halorussus salinisoli TaxID=2558242 RepID=UPI0010C23421|nr:hypothetical protein [Halorussus salinisoli]
MGFEDLDEAAGAQSKDIESKSASTISEMTSEADSETTASDGQESEQASCYEVPAFPFVQDNMQTNVYARSDWLR